MSEELIKTVIFGIPNFAGFTFAIFALLYVVNQQRALIMLLIEKWSECEDDEERTKIAGNLRKLKD